MKDPMLKQFIFISIVLLFTVSCGSAAQQSYSDHSVQPGETVYSISKKYNISEQTLINLNPTAKDGLKVNSVLILPTRNLIGDRGSKMKRHTVKRKETLNGIAQLYNVSTEDIKKINKELYSRSIRTGEKLMIPSTGKNGSNVEPVSKTQKHTVKPKETKYGIARMYGITVAELEKLNPEMGQILDIGQTLIVPNTMEAVAEPIDTEKYDLYEVKPKEGFYALKRKFELSEEEIIALNPIAIDGLKDGMIIKIPKGLMDIALEDVNVVNLENRITNKKAKNIAVLLPFRLNKNSSDTTDSDTELIKQDPTLRVSLDFYSGVLMAAEFAKDKGISVNLNVFDTQKDEEKITEVIRSKNIKSMDAVIGPLLQKNVESAAAILRDSETPVFSPLSNRDMNMYPNFFQTLPTQSVLDASIFRYLKEHGTGKNIIIVSDSKTQKKKDLLLKTFPEAKSVSPREGGYIQSGDIAKVANANAENWIILESSNTVLVTSVVSVLSTMPASYGLRLFTTEKNDAYDYNEVSNTKLAKLNFTFPSVNKRVNEDDMNPFLISYKNKYGVMPNRYAIRGFDITYDILLRLASDNDNLYDAIRPEEETQYIENKFRYVKSEAGGYGNQSAYILKYNKDLEFEVVK